MDQKTGFKKTKDYPVKQGVGSPDLNETGSDSVYLDYAEGIRAGAYKWFRSEDGAYYYLASVDAEGQPLTVNFTVEHEGKVFHNSDTIGVFTSTKITNRRNQCMIVTVPAGYLAVDENGEVMGINTETRINGYTAETAPVIFGINSIGWRSGGPSVRPKYIDQGYVYASCGSRSCDAVDEGDGVTRSGKAPRMVTDYKAGIIQLRANADILPGNMDAIITVGASGSGQMSSIIGASGNMKEYYPYMFRDEIPGVSYDPSTDTYSSRYSDAVLASMCYCPIADIENADIANAWMRFDSTTDGHGNPSPVDGRYSFTDFQLKLQELEALAFVDYINSLGLVDFEGKTLTLDSPRSGTYYDAVLKNISDSLNAFAEKTTFPCKVIKGFGPRVVETPYSSLDEFMAQYGNYESWLKRNEDGSFEVTDLAGFVIGTKLVRNKNIPGFDSMDLSTENTAFGDEHTTAVHFSPTVAHVLKENYALLSALDGFDKEAVDRYIREGLDETIGYQTSLENATRLLLGKTALHPADPAKYFRTRNGTADEHISFSVAYNICLAAAKYGRNADYSLVWHMAHDDREGTTTGTFTDWVDEIMRTEGLV